MFTKSSLDQQDDGLVTFDDIMTKHGPITGVHLPRNQLLFTQQGRKHFSVRAMRTLSVLVSGDKWHDFVRYVNLSLALDKRGFIVWRTGVLYIE